MSYPSWNTLLQSELAEFDQAFRSKTLLWLADENFDLTATEIGALPDATTVLTNRFDIANAVINGKGSAFFNDFEPLSTLFDYVIYLVSKERLLSNYCIEFAMRHLLPTGALVLGGKKQHGIKTYYKTTQSNLGGKGQLKKLGDRYLALMSFPQLHSDAWHPENYRTIQYINTCFGYQLYSKPGVYGWQKVDLGSSLLANCVVEQSQNGIDIDKSVLDLGCGSGYLTLMVASLGYREITATDNNAAALDAIRFNCAKNNLSVDIKADDCGQNIGKKFDIILCNPPFHQGFDQSRDMLDKFLVAAKTLLKSDGYALFVVNAFIPIEIKAKGYFTEITTLANNKQFKVIKLSL